MAQQTAINTADDMRWLREVHLPRLPAKYKSAIIIGNEDYPDRIEVYERRDPRVTDVPVIFKADDEGVFKEAPLLHHATMKASAKQPKGALMRNVSTPSEEKYQTWDGNVIVTNFKRGLWSVHPRGHEPFMVGSKREAFDQALGIATRKWGAK